MAEIKLTAKTRLVVEPFNGRSGHGSFPGVRIRLAGKRTSRILVTMHASRALELADALQSVFACIDEGDDFFQSPAWLRLRYEVLKKHHGRCQASLDNQSYKAMKALREAQEWRFQTIDGQPETNSEAA